MVKLEPASNVNVVILCVDWNAFDPILVTLAGISISIILDAFWNAPFPMLVKVEPASNITVTKPLVK